MNNARCLLGLMVVLVLSVEAVQADTIQTTYICKDARGHVTAQGAPCPTSAATSREVPTVHHDFTLGEAFRNLHLKMQADQERRRCDLLRHSQSAIDQRAAAESCR